MPWPSSGALLDDLLVAAVVADTDGVVRYANDAARRLYADTPPLVGSLLRERLFAPSEQGAADEVLTIVLRGERWAGELALLGPEGRPRSLATSWSPLHEDGVVPGVVLLAEDVRPAQVLDRRLDRLASVSTDLLAAETVADVAAVVTGPMADAAGATIGSVSLVVDEETLALVGLRGGPADVATRWATYSRTSATPAAEALRTRRPIVLVGRAEIERRYPDLERAAEGERSMASLPLVVGDRDLGVVSMSFPGLRRFDDAELLFLTLLADMAAQAIDRIHAQGAAADRESKLRFLAEATTRLSGVLDYEGTLAAVAEAAVPWFADWCAIAVLEDDRLRTIAVAHADPASEALVDTVQQRYPPAPDAVAGPYEVVRTGRSVLVPEITPDMLALRASDEEHLRLLEELGPRSMLICPLRAGDRVLGAIMWVAGEGSRRFDQADQAFGEDLARRAGVAIDNADLHSQLRDVALRLQQAVLPDRLPLVPGWESAVVYQPSGRTDAGGDFYDVIGLDGGRVACFVGDVMGRGVRAASVMAQMRSAVRTLVALDPDPACVLAGLDLVFERLGLDHLVTLGYAVGDPVDGTLELVSAGHPAPLVLRADGDLEVLDPPETVLLGAGGDERRTLKVDLAVGDTALLFTDGLVERRGEDTDVGTERLAAAVRRHAGQPLATLLGLVVGEVRDPTRDDDVAVLALTRTA